MVEPGTALLASTAIWGSKELMLKILGPTAEYIGDDVKSFVAKCNLNLDNIFSNALDKLGTKTEEPGQVSPRLLKQVLDEGCFCEDEILVEYFGGMLAASRTVDGKDDTAIYYVSLIKSLSRYQLIVHYLLYYRMFQLTKVKGLDLRSLSDRESIKIFIPERIIKPLFGVEKDLFQRSTHSISGLSANSLIFRNSIVTANPNVENILEPGIITGPTILGIELFLLACGINDIGIDRIKEVVLPTFFLELDINEIKLIGHPEEKKESEQN